MESAQLPAIVIFEMVRADHRLFRFGLLFREYVRDYHSAAIQFHKKITIEGRATTHTVAGRLHREESEGPAFDSGADHKEWFRFGKLHRIAGPAMIYADMFGTYHCWIENGKTRQGRCFQMASYLYIDKYFSNEAYPMDDDWEHPDDVRHQYKNYQSSRYKPVKGQERLTCRCIYSFGMFHSESGPAYIKYDRRGRVRTEKWFVRGDLYRKEGPSIVKYNAKGIVVLEVYARVNPYYLETPGSPYMIQYDDQGRLRKEIWPGGKKLVFRKYRDGNLLYEVKPSGKGGRFVKTVLPQ